MAKVQGDEVIKLGSFHYLHVQDTNLNIVRIEVGPKTFTRLEHEKVIEGPLKMVIIPPRHYAVIDNPVSLDKKGDIEYDKYGQIKLRFGDQEVKFEQDPFPLYPGQKLAAGGIQPLQVVPENASLRLKAKRDFVDRYAKNDAGASIKRRAGEEWMFGGLATYFPQSEVEIVQTYHAKILRPNQALKLRARDDCIDVYGKARKPGEQWLVRREGAYIPGVNEIDEGVVDAIVLTPKTAIHVQAITSFVDANGVERKSGEEWLVTRAEHETYIPDVNEIITNTVPLVILSSRQWCVIADPVNPETGKPSLGEREYRRGPLTFFLKPGESLHNRVTDVTVLGPSSAIWVKAEEAFVDHNQKKRNAGDRWLVYGPGEYWPPIQAKPLNQIKAFLQIEPLGLYFFQPIPFIVVSILMILIAIILNKLVR